jgi:hypothetical protein
MDVDQKYCQSCHLISRNGLSFRKKRAQRYVANVWPMLSECSCGVQLSREYAERFSERHHPEPHQFINLVQWRNRQERTQNFRKL